MKILAADKKNAAKVTKTLIFLKNATFAAIISSAGLEFQKNNSCMLFLIQKDRNLMLWLLPVHQAG